MRLNGDLLGYVRNSDDVAHLTHLTFDPRTLIILHRDWLKRREMFKGLQRFFDRNLSRISQCSDWSAITDPFSMQ